MAVVTATAEDATSSSGKENANNACSAFAWPVKRERAWFASQDLPHRVSGARLRRIDRAVELTLKPVRAVDYLLPPHALKAGAYGGSVVFFGVPHPGVYQVTLSETADIDVFENGTRLTAQATSRAPDCPDARLSARFDLAPGDLVLVEVINAPQTTIKIAFAEAER